MKLTRPLLRYHGGKWRIAPWIISHFPEHRIYVEPFGGAASVLMRKPQSWAEVINDLDGDIINVFRVLRDPKRSSALEKKLRLTPWSRDEFWATYKKCSEPVERARRTIVRQFMSFSTTGRRKNRSGFRAIPYRNNQTGVHDWLNYPDSIRVFVERLQGVTIENRPALEIIRQQDSPETLFYCDPPYPTSTRSSIKWSSDNDRAYIHDMTDEDHITLAKLLHKIKGMVIVSGYDCPLYRDLYRGWGRDEKRALADGARPRKEILWMSPNIRETRLFGEIEGPRIP